MKLLKKVMIGIGIFIIVWLGTAIYLSIKNPAPLPSNLCSMMNYSINLSNLK